MAFGIDFGNFMNPNAVPTPTPTPAAPQTVNDLYAQVLGRAPDAGGASYWSGQFGDTVDANELATFKSAAQAELANRTPAEQATLAPNLVNANAQAPVNNYFAANKDVADAYKQNSYGLTPDQFAAQHYNQYGINEQRANPLQSAVAQWAAANPTASPYQITQAIAQNGGLTPEMADAVARQYGTTVDVINSGYQTNQGINGLYQTYLGRTPESQQVVDQWAKEFGSTIEPEEIAAFRQAAAPELRNTGYLSDPTKGEIKDYVSSVLADNSLSDWQKTNKIMEQAQKSGISQSQIEAVYGKDAVQPYMDTYKSGINSFLTDTLAKEQGTTLNEVGAIHQAAQKYGLTADEIAKYGGLDPNQVKSYFDQYDQGLGTIVARMNDPKTDDITKTKTALALAQQYGTTDAELAKASNGKYTEKEIAAYLDPVRNIPTGLQKLFADPNATAKDITKFVADAKLDPRAAGIYGAALDKVLTNTPALYLRDASTGKADVSDSYDSFLAAAKATPEMATQYAPQIQAIEQAKSIIGKHALNKDFGGEYKDFAMEMFLGLDKNTSGQAPKQLEIIAPKTEKATAFDEYNQPYTYTKVTPAELKSGQKGVEAIRDEDGGITGYTKLLDAKAFDETWPGQKERFGVRANYDAAGNLTGYTSGARVHVSDPQYYQAKWDANGSPKPITGANRGGGFAKGLMADFADLGPIGTIALMAATGGLGSLAAGALANTAVGAALGTIGTNAVASGLVSGAMSELGGGEFGKGFVGGAVGSGVGSLAQGAMPTGGLTTTGMPMVDSYLTQALPKAAGSMASTGVMGGDMGDAGLYSLLNTGVNMGTNSLLQNSGIGTLDPKIQPYAAGVGSNLITSALTGKDPNLQNALMKTMMQQAMSTGKQAVKTAAKP